MQLDHNSLMRHIDELQKNRDLSRLAVKSGAARKVKFKTKPDGTTVKSKRVRRKKKAQPTSLQNPTPSKVFGSDRVTLTSELNKPAPVQSKPNAIWAKRPRYRSLQPGIGNLVAKAVR